MKGAARRGIAVGTAVAVLGVTLSLAPPILELEEAVALRGLFLARGSLPPPATVAVVAVSAASAARVGQPPELDEWSRAVHADLIDRLAHWGAAAIVFDMSFEAQRDAGDDRKLADSIRRAGNVILFERVVSERLEVPGRTPPGVAQIETRVPPLPPLKDAAWASAPFVLPRVPVRVNQFWTFGRSLGGVPTLPVVALQAYLAPHYEALIGALATVAPEVVEGLPQTETELRATNLEAVIQDLRDSFRSDPELADRTLDAVERWGGGAQLSERVRPLVETYAGRDSRYLNFYGPARTILTIPYDAVFDPSAARAADVAGRVIFVGYSEPRQAEQQDEFYSVYSERTGQSLSGVEIGATAFANLLERSSVMPLGVGLQLIAVTVWALVIGVLLVMLPVPMAAFGAGALAAAYLGGAYAAFQSAGLFIPSVTPVLVQLPAALLAAVIWNYRVLRVQRERIRAALGRYVPQKVADRLAQETMTGSAGELLHGTCLFTDAEQYTALAESMDPTALGAFMNQYYETMFRAVQRNGGEIADVAGDSMVAVWAATEMDPKAQIHACAAALDVAAAVEQFNETRGRRGLPTRIGLDSGAVFLGNIGAEHRHEYRAVGDIVSTASRIQGLNRLLGTRILISDAVLVRGGFTVRDVGAFLLRGKATPLRIHELIAPGGEMPDGAHGELHERFAAALRIFRTGDWRTAENAFAALLERFPDDGPTAFYADLSRRHRRDPPAEWLGVVSIAVK